MHTSLYYLSCIQDKGIIDNLSYLIKISMVDYNGSCILYTSLYCLSCIQDKAVIDNVSYLIKISIVDSMWMYTYLSVLPVLYTGQGNYLEFLLPDQNFHGGIMVDVYIHLCITCPVYTTRQLFINSPI